MKAHTPLKVYTRKKYTGAKMVIGFSGWMDGGDVSTGTLAWLIENYKARHIGEIQPEGFYVYNMPGPMDVASMYRPTVRIEEGVIRGVDMPTNFFYAVPDHNIVLFEGREPNLDWERFADSILNFAERVGISTIYFVGSFASEVPHTRAPRLMAAVNNPDMKTELEQSGVQFADFEGPASFAAYLMTQAAERGVQMACIVAEVPIYIEGLNPRGIEGVTRKLTRILGLPASLDAMRRTTDRWERKLDMTLQKKKELAEYVRKLESDYDRKLFDSEMTDFKEWLLEHGVRVD